jgi:hypothetical protein
MLPWFIYLLIQFGYLATPEEWNTKTPAEKQQLEIIIEDFAD